MTKLFGTDGIRGEAGKFPLDAATVQTVGHSLALHLKNKLGRLPSIVSGRDTRESGEWIERALVEGVSRAGAECRSAGVITTPGVAFLARTLPADAGIVISASHNAYHDNGIKIFATSGRKLDESTERLIEKDVLSGIKNPPDVPETNVSSRDESGDLKTRYLDYLANQIGRGLTLKGLSVVVDSANGAASSFAPELLSTLGAQVTAINDNPDGRNINLNCGSLHLEGLQDEVLKHGADLGVAVDGDADRSLFVDSEGRIVNGDASLWVLAKYLRAQGQLNKDTVVATVMSNIGLEIAFRSVGISLIRTDVGDKYVLEELLRREASLGGEQSGHIIFPHVSLAGDGLITTLYLLRAMSESEKPLHELTVGFETLPQVLVNVAVREKRPFDEVARIKGAAKEIESSLGSRGRLLLRYSGTEPLARVMLEGESQSEIEKQANELAGVIRETLGA